MVAPIDLNLVVFELAQGLRNSDERESGRDETGDILCNNGSGIVLKSKQSPQKRLVSGAETEPE